MKHLFLLGLALAGLVSNAETKTNCFIDGSNTPRCYSFELGPDGSRIPPNLQNPYVGVSWPVYTDSSPELVWAESNRRWDTEAGGPDLIDHSAYKPNVRYVQIGAKHYPDVICLVWDRGSKVCFDTMEITER